MAGLISQGQTKSPWQVPLSTKPASGTVIAQACFPREEKPPRTMATGARRAPELPGIRWGLLFLLVSASLVPSCLALANSRPTDGYTITGLVRINGGAAGAYGLTKLSNAKVILNGGQSVTFLRPDGYFSFHNVPAGTHLVEVSALGYFFSPVRVDVSARHPGKVQAALTENRRPLTELVLEPLREEQYYEVKAPFSVMSMVKSPMGLMMGFMLLVVFVMPKMIESIDPEEMKKAQEEMRNQGVPTFSSLLAGRNG